MNLSNSTEKDIYFIDYPPVLLDVTIVIGSLIAIAGIFGNLVTVIALVRSHRLETATTPYIVSLCASDFLYCSFNIPVILIAYGKRRWFYNDALCCVFAVTHYFCSTLSVFSIIAITINRYILIIHPSRYKSISSKKGVSLGVLSACTVALFLVTMPLYKVWGKYGFDKTFKICTVLPHRGLTLRTYIYALYFVIVPSMLIFCYSRIYWVVKKSENNIRQQVKATSETQPNKIPLHKRIFSDKRKTSAVGEEGTPIQPHETSKDLRLLRMILIIFGVFVLVHVIPLTVFGVLGKKTSPSVRDVVSVIWFLGKCINPVVYVSVSREYRQSYGELFRCSRNTSPEGDSASCRTSDRNATDSAASKLSIDKVG